MGTSSSESEESELEEAAFFAGVALRAGDFVLGAGVAFRAGLLALGAAAFFFLSLSESDDEEDEDEAAF